MSVITAPSLTALVDSNGIIRSRSAFARMLGSQPTVSVSVSVQVRPDSCPHVCRHIHQRLRGPPCPTELVTEQLRIRRLGVRVPSGAQVRRGARWDTSSWVSDQIGSQLHRSGG